MLFGALGTLCIVLGDRACCSQKTTQTKAFQNNPHIARVGAQSTPSQQAQCRWKDEPTYAHQSQTRIRARL